jgi:hypothetical protein
MTKTGAGSAGSVTPKQALAFVKKHGVVLQAARGPVPSFAEYITGEPIKGSWWAHSKGHEIFALASAVSDHPDVLVCKLIDGKVTYVHRRLWPALVKLAARFEQVQLAQVAEEHTKTGAHRSITTPFPKWVPDDVASEAERLSVADAERLFAPILDASPPPKRKRKRARN